MIERSPREHPEMRGKRLETVAPKDQTIKKVTTTIQEQLQGKKVGFIETDDANYTCINFIQDSQEIAPDSIITVVHKKPTDEDELTIDYTITQLDQDKYKIKKVEIPQRYIREGDRNSILINKKRLQNMKDQEELEDLTRLPKVSEAEVERLLLDLIVGKAQIDLE